MSNADDIKRLEAEIEKLKQENFELKKCIRSAIGTLKVSNSEMRNTLTGSKRDDIFSPNFKEPSWLRDEENDKNDVG